MPDATKDRPDDVGDRRDLIDQLGADVAQDVIREAMEASGAQPGGDDWSRRRSEMIALIESLDARVQADLDARGL
jgi:hypothetical protein